MRESQWGQRSRGLQPPTATRDLPGRHDHARLARLTLGEDGLAGFCDIEQRLCMALAVERAPIPITDRSGPRLVDRGQRAIRRDVKVVTGGLTSTRCPATLEQLALSTTAAGCYLPAAADENAVGAPASSISSTS